MSKTAQEIINHRKEQWEQHHDINKDREFTDSIAKYFKKFESKELKHSIYNNPELLIEMLFVVVNKDKHTTPFFFNDVQRSFVNDLNQAIIDYKAGKRNHLKFLVLKGRQQGISAIVSALQLAYTLIIKNFSGFTLADNAPNTTTLFQDKARFTYDNLPELFKPKTKYDNRIELHFEINNSKWRVATAGSDDIGRSKTLNFFHGSECAFYPNLKNTLIGLSESFTRDCIVILETTPNGYNEYKDMCDEAKNGLNNYDLKFYEWWLTSEYRLNFETEDKEIQFKNDVFNNKSWIFDKCKWLIEFIKLDWNQVYWYYNKWREKKEWIKQEYPCTIDEGFLASGRNVFDNEILIVRKEYLKRLYAEKPPLKGRFTFQWVNPDAKDSIIDNTIKFVPDNNGFITIHEDVKQGYPYVIGGDTKGDGRDFFTATVMNNVTGKRCATLHANLDADVYSYQMYCLGKYFNTALIGIEVNFNTYPIQELQRLRYHKQYVREKQDTFTGEILKKFGWKTDENTRRPMIDREIILIRDNIELFTDIPFIDECLTFIIDKKNKPDAKSGSHDDIIISDCICNEIRRQQITTIAIQKEINDNDYSAEAKAWRNFNKLTSIKSRKGRKGVVI